MPHRCRHALALPTALVAVAPLALAAQAPVPPGAGAPIDSGAVVRVTAPRAGLQRARARAVASSGDSLTVRRATTRRDSADVSVAWQDVTALDVSGGVDRGAGARRGAVTGALIVGVPGTAFTAAYYWHEWRQDQRNRCGEFCYLGPAIMAVLTVGGTGIGALAGALIGAGTGRERWHPTRVPARVGLVPLPNGVGVRLAF